jgi:hypothetical protein
LKNQAIILRPRELDYQRGLLHLIGQEFQMNTWRHHLIVFSCALAFMAAEEGMTLAGQKRSMDGASSGASLHPRKPKPAQNALPPKATGAVRSSVAEPKPNNLRKPVITPLALSKKSYRATKARKKIASKAVLQPRTNLIHYGVLKDSQRYDPSPYSPHGGLPHPQTLDLTFDHFQELDRNQDGVIDPVERAFGRIDMDRDLRSRTLR